MVCICLCSVLFISFFLFFLINKLLRKFYGCINMSVILFLGINAGVAGCCTGLALSFPGKVSENVQSINSLELFYFTIAEQSVP